jgi:glutathione peroxidase
MNPFKAFFATLSTSKKTESFKTSSIYDIKINTLQGKPLDFSRFRGKYILIVNVASKCGFTPQYKELQELYDSHRDSLEIIGAPCNQFGQQEPGDDEAISQFCEVNYGVSFTITEKIEVKGNSQHPLYQWLTQARKNGHKNSSVKWNFQKYLINPEGQLIDFFYSMTSPKSIKIRKHLK